MTSNSHGKPVALNAMTFPLHGARLIEASAGTGKTFTIAGLYLRLLLGHGSDETRHEKRLTVDQILVVTFTEAATSELRDRIRARIHAARLAFARSDSQDPVIKPLLTEIPDHAAACAILLQAERQMDEAAIYTIHGFCQRMLTQNAFESGSRFSNEFIKDESNLKAQVVADYWRKQFYGLSIPLASSVRDVWGSPSALLHDVGRYLSGAELTLTTNPLEGSLGELHQQNLAKINALKQAWLESVDDFLPIISSSGVNKRSYSKISLPNNLNAVTAWANTPTQDYHLSDKLERFAQKVLIDKTPKGSAPTHDVFVMIDELLANPADLKLPLLSHAITECRVMLAKAKQQQQKLSFDDLLTQLSAAIDSDEQALLVERIRNLYPVAMIDEFQDTDPLQYSIFSQIYLNSPQCGLFMIGDPKQAIYGFRGADIFTYIKARQQVNAHYTLGTNWRSSADMVSAVNQVFSKADSPFIYDDNIPFLAVNSSPNADQRYWLMNDEPQKALTYWLQDADSKTVSNSDYNDEMAAACVSQIQTILSAAQDDNAHFVNGDKKKVITAGDIAVLVRTGKEGKQIKDLLAQQGIASVYLSNRDSVFSSLVARDVQRLLQAVLTPESERVLRASLASELFALTPAQLDELNNDEIEWENAINEFKLYRQVWQKRGVLPMLRSVLSKRHIPERLLSDKSGERHLTDFMHLGELLQQASQEIDSDHGLIRWLSEGISDIENGLTNGVDEHIQRLESERNLVQIVTIHKSKGLEYDLVFLPFLASYRMAKDGKYYDESQQQTVLDFSKNAEVLKQADKERLAEDLRLAYVALTRAVYGCFIGIGPVRQGRTTKEPTGVHLGSIGYLIQNGQELGVAELSQRLQLLTENNPQLCCIDPPTLSEDVFVAEHAPMVSRSANQLQAHIDRSWRITSYSGLVKQGSHGGSHTQVDHDASMEVAGFDMDSATDLNEIELEEPQRSIFTFPRGARPGTFLHTLFEQVQFTEPADSEHNTQVIEQLLHLEQYDSEWLPILQTLVDDVLSCDLNGKGLQLKHKQPQQLLVEMEFLLPIEVLSAPALNRVIQYHDPLSAKAGDLGFYTVQGMLKGFIDLVFEHEGKYYVLDWKSNHLGDEPSLYHTLSLQTAMSEHRYDLQYQIYALALHRFLRSRLGNYDYEQHFGGVYYLFLRGVDGSREHGIFNAKPSLALLNELDSLIDGKEMSTRSNDAGQMGLI